MTMQNSKKQQTGVTLIELMIALVIGSIIMIGVGTVYSGTKRSAKVQDEFSRMQENGRFALNYIARFVREAGYAGCGAGGTNTNTLADTTGSNNFAVGLEGYEAAGTAPGETVGTPLDEYPTVSSTAANWTQTTLTTAEDGTVVDGSADSPVPNSDILIARGVDGSGVELIDPTGSGQVFVSYTDVETGGCADGSDKVSGICQGDILVASDCEQSITFQATNLQPVGGTTKVNVVHAVSGHSLTPGNDSEYAAWGGSSGSHPELQLGQGSELMVVTTKYFYIGAGQNGPALFMRQGDAAGQELVEGVENMQVLYGEDTDITDPDNIPDHYVPADRVADFANVVSVRVTLLLRSVNEIPHRTDTAQTKIVGGTTAATGVTLTSATDKRMRHIMSLTIKLRNRAFSL